MSLYFNFWKMCWDNKYIVDVDMYKQAVQKTLITAEEFKTITSQDYVV